MEGKKYFPKAILCKGRLLLREYIKGAPLMEYIKENGLSRSLALNLINFAEFFQDSSLRLDGISKHLFIQDDESIKIIDPRRKKYYIYRPILRALKKEGALEKFLTVLNEERPDLALKWSNYISKLNST